MIGGFKTNSRTNETWFIHFDANSQKYAKGPHLSRARNLFGCELFHYRDETYIIAVGGNGNGDQTEPTDKTTEFLNLKDMEWKNGKNQYQSQIMFYIKTFIQDR